MSNFRTIVGVIVGGVVDIVTSGLFALPVMMYALVKYQAAGSPDASQIVMQGLAGDPVLISIGFVTGSLASILAGYVAAWIARGSELVVGAGSAYLCVALGVLSLVHGASGSLALHLLGFVLSPALGLLGGYLRSLQIRRRTATV